MHKGHPVSDAVMFVPRDVGFLQTRNPIGTSDATKFTNKSSFLEGNPWEIARLMSELRIQIPPRGKIYSANTGNIGVS